MKGVIRWRDGRPQYFVDGEEVSEEVFASTFRPVSAGGRQGDSLQGWKRPLSSEALAVHPDQIKEATEDARLKGVSTDFNEDGSPQFRDRDHRRRYCKAYGFYDRDGGYGDAQIGGTRGRDKEPDRPDFDLSEANSQTGVEVRREGPRYFRAS